MQTILKGLATLTIIVMIATGCNTTSSADPKTVLTEFMDRLSKKDFDGAAKLATKESQSMFSMMKMGMEMAEKYKGSKEELEMTEEMKSMEIGTAKIDGETAVVPVKNKKRDIEVEFSLRKEGGGWKVDFNMQTMMKMANDAKQQEGADSPGNTISTEDMQKGLQIADSVLKHMDPEKMKEMMKAAEKMKEQQ